MAKVKIITRNMKTDDVDDVIRFQLLYYAFIHDFKYNPCEMRCLMLLAKNNGIRQADFCNICVESGVYQSGQSARNFVAKAMKDGTIKKIDGKRISLDESLEIYSEGNIMFNLKFLYATSN